MASAIKRKYKQVEIAEGGGPVGDAKGDYIITTWGTKDDPQGVQDNYECVHCQYATLDADKMNEHLDKRDHRWPWPKKDGDGRNIRAMHPLLTPEDQDEEVED